MDRVSEQGLIWGGRKVESIDGEDQSLYRTVRGVSYSGNLAFMSGISSKASSFILRGSFW
jgi:hypothetical protein